MSNDDFDDEELEEIADQIQVGDRTEGARALERVISRARSEGRGEVRQVLKEEAMAARLERENSEALDHFSKRYPQMKDSELLVDAAQTALRKEIVSDLKNAGITDEYLAPVRNDTATLVRAHGSARYNGANVRAPKDLLDQVGSTLAREFRIHPVSRAPAETVQMMREQRGFADRDAREGRYEPAAPSVRRIEPQRASQQSAATRTAYAPSAPSERAKEHVRQMRAARGFPPSGY